MLKRVSSEELGKYISNLASEHFNKYYSDNFVDYIEDIRTDTIRFVDDHFWYNLHIELTEAGKEPLIIEFVEEDVTNGNEEILEINYYIYIY